MCLLPDICCLLGKHASQYTSEPLGKVTNEKKTPNKSNKPTNQQSIETKAMCQTEKDKQNNEKMIIREDIASNCKFTFMNVETSNK